MTTKVTPDNLDNTKDFSSLVPAVFEKANAAFVLANTANTTASAGGGGVSFGSTLVTSLIFR